MEHDGAEPYALASQAADAIALATGRDHHDVAVVLGSGWQQAVAGLGTDAIEVPTASLPGFIAPTVAGHGGLIRSAEVGAVRVLFLVGRVHLYEGNPPARVVHPVRAAILAGARTVVLTNAAGGINRDYRPGQAVLVRDHLNLTGASPLSGPPPPEPYGSRFVDLTAVYPEPLRAIARGIDASLVEGVYAGFVGPQYETPAEVAMARSLGADLVGMSTVLEAIAARHLGAQVLGISLVTNLAAGVSPEPLNHLEVLAAGEAAAPRLEALLGGILPQL